MSVTVLTPATPAPAAFRLTTMEVVMKEITLEDNLLFAESLLDQASAAIARECHTIFAQQAYREVQPTNYDTQRLLLRYRPLVSVSSVSHGGTVITDYRIDSADGAILYRHGGWFISPWATEDWTVDYIAGFIGPEQLTPPDPTGPTLRNDAADLERAAIECIKVWFNERIVSDRIQSRTLGDQRIDYGIQALSRGIPALSKDLLRNWRRVVLA